MTIRLEEKIVLFHEKERKQRNVIFLSSDKIFLCLCVSVLLYSLYVFNISRDFNISKPPEGINHEIERKGYVAAVVDVSVITTTICNKVET